MNVDEIKVGEKYKDKIGNIYKCKLLFCYEYEVSLFTVYIMNTPLDIYLSKSQIKQLTIM